MYIIVSGGFISLLYQISKYLNLETFCRGWEQLEVTCNPYTRDTNNLWNVEDHVNKRRKFSAKDFLSV